MIITQISLSLFLKSCLRTLIKHIIGKINPTRETIAQTVKPIDGATNSIFYLCLWIIDLQYKQNALG